MFSQQLSKRTLKARTLGYCASPNPCGPALNSGKRASRGEPGLKTLDNDLDARLTLVKGGKTLC